VGILENAGAEHPQCEGFETDHNYINKHKDIALTLYKYLNHVLYHSFKKEAQKQERLGFHQAL
jgi:hypothetical protein